MEQLISSGCQEFLIRRKMASVREWNAELMLENGRGEYRGSGRDRIASVKPRIDSSRSSSGWKFDNK
jgi:hypothetical protein